MKNFDLDDVLVIENGTETQEEFYSALQRAINSLEAWKFQGSYGRTMMEAIESGRCVLGKEGCRDYWGNRIPSRTEVKAGTKGSVEFVTEKSGADWAKMIAGI